MQGCGCTDNRWLGTGDMMGWSRYLPPGAGAVDLDFAIKDLTEASRAHSLGESRSPCGPSNARARTHAHIRTRTHSRPPILHPAPPRPALAPPRPAPPPPAPPRPAPPRCHTFLQERSSRLHCCTLGPLVLRAHRAAIAARTPCYTNRPPSAEASPEDPTIRDTLKRYRDERARNNVRTRSTVA